MSKTSHKYLPALIVFWHVAHQELPGCCFKIVAIVDVSNGCRSCLIWVQDNDQIKNRQSRQKNEMKEKLVSVCGQTNQCRVMCLSPFYTPLQSNIYIVRIQPSPHAVSLGVDQASKQSMCIGQDLKIKHFSNQFNISTKTFGSCCWGWHQSMQQVCNIEQS